MCIWKASAIALVINGRTNFLSGGEFQVDSVVLSRVQDFFLALQFE